MILQTAYVVQSGLREERKLEAISNHLANASTAGFKADVLSFDAMLQAQMTVDFTPGDLKQTGNDLDVALGEEGFFKIRTPRGIRYTRNGTFTLNKDNMLVTQSGDPVLGDRGPILIQGNEIEINESGEIHVDKELVGTLGIVTFDSKGKLMKEGNSLFVNNGAAGEEKAPERAIVRQGALEMANVSIVMEMTKMVETMRRYETCMKMLQSLDETDAKAISDLGKV